MIPKATITIDGKTIEVPIIKGSCGPDVLDISNFYQETGMFCYDPGFTSTASCASSITFINGDEGILLYRGYPIEDLVEKCDFLEVAYLLLYGELPDTSQRESFEQSITNHSMLHEQLRTFFQGFRRDARPMAVMVGVVGALSAFYHDNLDIYDPHNERLHLTVLLLKCPQLQQWHIIIHEVAPYRTPKIG